MKSHPHFAIVMEIYRKIEASGHQVYLAGGCVRDGLLDRVPNDFDLATSATPDQIIELFEKTIPVGKAFGTVIVVQAGVEFEVTTFRSDGLYEDGRHPTVVQFSSAEEDAKRRDFTINALFYDAGNDRVVDFVGGMADLKSKLIRAVGNPSQRFLEDHLRMLRAVRFLGQLNFEIEEFTQNALRENASRIVSVSAERIHQELTKLLLSANFEKALHAFKALGFLQTLFPGLPLHFGPWKNHWPEGSDSQKELKVWFLFWNMLWVPAFKTELSMHFSQLRFSSKQIKSLEKMLLWRAQPNLFIEKSLGELLELCFDEDHWQAVQIYSSEKILDHEKFLDLKKRFQDFQGKKPLPLLKAQDIPELQHAKLGNALRRAYWAQLENRIHSKEDARKLVL